MLDSPRKPPIVLPAASPPTTISKSAAFIFIHGLGDDAEGVEPVAKQFQHAGKLPHMSWILPNAIESRDYMMPAWYMPHKLTPFPPSRPELEDDEDEEGIKESASYIISLIDEQVAAGVPPNRIVLGGFSQGHAVALLTGLVSSRYSGKLAGLVGLSGYMPLADKIPDLRREAGLPPKMEDDNDVDVFVTRGTKDMFIPKRYLSICEQRLLDTGFKPERVTLKEYDGMGHGMRSDELGHLCMWLEKVVPPVE